MACARKVYSYGCRKKDGEEGTPWAGMMKEDPDKDSNEKESKLPSKKGVWSKVTGKSFTHPINRKCDESYDPFGFDDDDESLLSHKDGQTVPKTLYGSSKHSNVIKSKIGGKCLSPDRVSINAEELKLIGSPRKNDKSLSPPKDGEKKVSKTLYGFSKNPTVIKSKIDGKPLPQNSVTINAEELKLFGSPRKCDINNGPSQGVNKCVKLLQNSVLGKKYTTKKNKIVHEAKCRGVTDIKERLKGNKNQMTKLDLDEKVVFEDDNMGSVEITKTMLDSNKMNPRVRITKAKIDSNVMFGDDGYQNCQLGNRKAVLESKPVRGKLQSKDGNTLSVQFVDDNTVLAIKQKKDKHVLECDNILSNETCDAPEKHVTSEENELESDMDLLCTYDLKGKVKSKRSLFSYYDKHGNQSNSILNGNSKEFDIISTSDDSVDTIEETSNNTNLFSTKRSLYPNQSDFDDTAAKKSKPEQVLKGATCDFEDKHVLDQVESLGYPKVKKVVVSPFKSLKARPRKTYRRFSSLPTNISLDNEEMEDENKDELSSPPPLYRSNIFGFGKSGASVRVRRDEKELYTVVRNTMHAHECLEYGESQQFKDDLDYLLDGLKSKHNVSTRCLSALELASKCLSPEFRMHIKAHGIIENIFTILEDAFSEEQLLLCASMIMYVLAKDKLKINFNKKTIGFMLQVITKKRADFSKTQAYERMIKKIRTIFEKLEDVDIDLETIDAKVLAREALLSLTVKRTGEWFKDEIRELGGLDDVADQLYYCCKCIQKRIRIDQSCVQMKRCVALFSDMTYKSAINQAYLMTCRNSIVIESCIRTLHTITTTLDVHQELTTPVAECLMSIQLLLMNLSHENKNACLKICKQENGLDSILRSALHLSQYLPSNMAYENTIVSLCLMVNLVADNPQNRTTLNKTVTTDCYGHQGSKEMCQQLTPVEALMQMFLLHSEACKEADLMKELEKLEQEENEQDAGRHYQDDEYALTCGDKFEDTIEDETEENLGGNPPKVEARKETDYPLNETEKRDIQSALVKAQRHMEDSHLAAYTAMLIGLLTEDELENQEIVHSLLPDGNFTLLLDSILKVLSFMEMTNPLSKNDLLCMERIMEVIKNCNERFKEKG